MPLTILNFYVVYILSVSVLQAYLCIDLKLLGIAFLAIAYVIAIFNSKKVVIEKSDFIIVLLLILLNIFYTFVELRGTIFALPTYILLLSLVLSKLIFPYISPNVFLKKINIIYFIIVIGLLLEYIILLLFGTNELVHGLHCNIPGIKGYRYLQNTTSTILNINVSGLNSLMLGAQTASQLAVIAATWYFFKNKNQKNVVNKFLLVLAIMMLILSPSITSILLLFISITFIFFIYISNIYHERVSSFYKAYIFSIISILSIYFIIELFSFKYPDLDYVVSDLIMVQLEGFNSWSISEALLGADFEKINSSFTATEMHFVQQISLYGLVGVGLFYGSIIYYLLRVLKLSVLMHNKRLMLVPIVIIIMLFIFGEAHYFVMMRAGIRELFAIHLAYIIYQGSSANKYTNNGPSY